MGTGVLILLLILLGAGRTDANSIVAEPPPSLVPKAPIDPSSFALLSKEDFAAGNAEVHAVFVDAGKPREDVPPRGATPSAVFPYAGHPPVSTIEVQVAITGRPVVLVLGSYRSAHWKLEIPPEAHVEKVIAQGYY